MDNFLQLVPIGTDADSDPVLVYGEEDDLDGHDTNDALDEPISDNSSPQFFDPLQHFVSGTPATATTISSGPQSTSAMISSAKSQEQQRGRYLQYLIDMQSDMLVAQSELLRRLDAVTRVAAIRDPAEQLAAYLPLLHEQRRDYEARRSTAPHEDSRNRADAANELLQCAREMTDAGDAEVALLAAFVFLGDDAPHETRRHSPNSIVPAIAVMLEESNGLYHHPY